MSSLSDREIAGLDGALARYGQNITLRSVVPGQAPNAQITFDVECRAFVRGYSANELVGGITQSDSRVIMSPTEIIREGWPGPNSSATPTNADRRIPKKGDKAVINGKVRNVEAAVGIYVDNELVRIEMRVLG